MKERKRPVQPAEDGEKDEAPAEKENKQEEEDDQIPPEVVASDFIARKQEPYDARRKFILNYC